MWWLGCLWIGIRVFLAALASLSHWLGVVTCLSFSFWFLFWVLQSLFEHWMWVILILCIFVEHVLRWRFDYIPAKVVIFAAVFFAVLLFKVVGLDICISYCFFVNLNDFIIFAALFVALCFNTVPFEILQIWIQGKLLVAGFLLSILTDMLMMEPCIFHVSARDVEIVLWIAAHRLQLLFVDKPDCFQILLCPEQFVEVDSLKLYLGDSVLAIRMVPDYWL